MWLSEGSFGDGHVRHHDCIDVSLLAMVLYYNFARCYIGRKWLKGVLDQKVD